LLFSLIGIGFAVFLIPLFFLGHVEEVIWINKEDIPSDYDVIVTGTEPEGITAAVASARNGMKTLLLGSHSSLGGLMTLGQLNFLDMCQDSENTVLTQGMFSEFYKAVGGTAFDITDAKNYFIELVTREPLLTLRTNAKLVSPVLFGSALTGVRVREGSDEFVYTAKRLIDATADGDLAALCGAPYTIGGEDIGEINRQMGVTLVFELSGVNWARVFFHLNFLRLKGLIRGTPAYTGATTKSAWGYEKEGYAYKPYDKLIRLRGFNIARQKNGTVLINALLLFGVDPLDQYSYLSAIDRAKTELTYLLPYIRKNCAGFEKAALAGTASQLYVRETRHFIGEYLLSIDDVLENRDQWDKIAIGSYPADVQPSVEQPFGTVIGNPDRYAVPFRCLVPTRVENLLIVGRSASFSSLAASSARVLPLGMVCGQAAGVAAAQSIKTGLGFRAMSRDREAISRLQETLKSQGAYLQDFASINPNASHWAYKGLADLRRLGLLDGGYENNYRLENPIDKWWFQFMINGLTRKAGYSTDAISIDASATNRQIIAAVAEVYLSARTSEQTPGTEDSPKKPDPLGASNSHRQNMELLAEAGILPSSLGSFFINSDATPQAAEVVMLLANLYNEIKR